jgi:hypothetical protein
MTRFKPTKKSANTYLIAGLTLAIVGLLILFVFNFDANFRSLALIFFLAIVLCLISAVLQKTPSIIPVILAGLGLVLLSFTYQTFGPEQKIVGTECPIIRECVRPVKGGGFPVQYVVDVPGISVRDVLGLEDEFRTWPFLADLCFYICLIELVRRFFQYLKGRGERQKEISERDTRSHY